MYVFIYLIYFIVKSLFHILSIVLLYHIVWGSYEGQFFETKLNL
jgi:hypothetical protein